MDCFVPLIFFTISIFEMKQKNYLLVYFHINEYYYCKHFISACVKLKIY